MAVEIGGEAEGGPVVADPDIAQRGLHLQIGVVDLGLQRVGVAILPAAVIGAGGVVLGQGQPALEGEGRHVSGLARNPLQVIEAHGRLLHLGIGVLGIVDRPSHLGGVAGDPLRLEIEEVVGLRRAGGEEQREAYGARENGFIH